jgi:hypothetical protein
MASRRTLEVPALVTVMCRERTAVEAVLEQPQAASVMASDLAATAVMSRVIAAEDDGDDVEWGAGAQRCRPKSTGCAPPMVTPRATGPASADVGPSSALLTHSPRPPSRRNRA